MIEYYAQIKFVHIVAVIASGTLFGLRGLAMLMNSGAGMSAPVRYLSYGMDTILLSAALMLWALLPTAVFANHWLTVKLLLILLYVVLGSFALKRGRTRRVRGVCFALAILIYVYVVTIAIAHHPTGMFAEKSIGPLVCCSPFDTHRRRYTMGSMYILGAENAGR